MQQRRESIRAIRIRSKIIKSYVQIFHTECGLQTSGSGLGSGFYGITIVDPRGDIALKPRPIRLFVLSKTEQKLLKKGSPMRSAFSSISPRVAISRTHQLVDLWYCIRLLIGIVNVAFDPSIPNVKLRGIGSKEEQFPYIQQSPQFGLLLHLNPELCQRII